MQKKNRLLVALLPALVFAVQSAAQDLAPYGFDDFFDTSRLLKIDLNVDPEDWNKLRVQHRSLVKTLRTDIPPSDQEKPFDYVPANLAIDGTDVGKVAIRKKGFVGSLDHNRPSLKIQIDNYEKKKMFAGVDTLTLNNNKQDRSRVHQLIGYQFFRAAGLPASHCNLALVSVNGKSLGIYSNVESLDKHYFRRAFKNAKGTLYEGTVCDFHMHSLIRFERKFGPKKAIASIKKTSIALDSNDRSILDKLGRHLDLDQFYRYWATEVLIGHWDGYVSNKNNYFVYFDSKSERLHFLPWGLDQLATDRNMFWRQGFDPPKSVKADAAIPRRLYKNTEARKKYFTAMRSLLDEVWDEDKLVAQIDDLQTTIKPHRIEKGFWSRR
ncbi:MAG TPA: CotH kinase family protein, partial [Verrucomicrobiota bacterium]|nr:CotH kinase family protein [Verrucomicrobiota bacterium]